MRGPRRHVPAISESEYDRRLFVRHSPARNFKSENMSGQLQPIDHTTRPATFDTTIAEALAEYTVANAANDEQACRDAFNKMLEAVRVCRRAARLVEARAGEGR